ncbi:hypothetical protein FZEAL_5432 [Fusarium zealandicum]|uniref:Xylanolytic transcriptional activator regulatory domain-containing protein n=1 Tax=Fusarium zealandicum TaxID=1053134 RepID=A0A8H4UKG2_9HYPO|nr:hypothetical protein FZEAL_5432 [Fusarium zealandicum]
MTLPDTRCRMSSLGTQQPDKELAWNAPKQGKSCMYPDKRPSRRRRQDSEDFRVIQPTATPQDYHTQQKDGQDLAEAHREHHKGLLQRGQKGPAVYREGRDDVQMNHTQTDTAAEQLNLQYPQPPQIYETNAPIFPQDQQHQTQTQSQFFQIGEPFSAPEGVGSATSAYDNNLDFPMDWLLINDPTRIDYSSIIELGKSPSNPQPTPGAFPYHGLRSTQGTPRQESAYQGSQHGSSSCSQMAASPSDTVSPLSQTSINRLPPGATKGGLYATSTDGARVPCTSRPRRASSSLRVHHGHPLPPVADDPNLNTMDQGPLAFPSLGHVVIPNVLSRDAGQTIRVETHEALCGKFRQLCLNPNDYRPRFASSEFPTVEHFNFFIALYFERFAPLFPIIHEQSFKADSHLPLTLAVAAIGCQYTQTREIWVCVRPMYEFLRRVIQVEQEMEEQVSSNLDLVQAIVLSQIGHLYSGLPKLEMMAKKRHGEIVSLVKFGGLLRPSNERDISGWGAADEVQRWTWWVTEETKRRLGYSIWLLDCMMAYHFGTETFLTLDIAQSDLPHDALWTIPSARDWHNQYEKTDRNPSLSAGVQQIFRDRHVKSDLGEFSRIVLLHGVYREVFQLKSYFQRSLVSWNPSEHSLRDDKHNQGQGSTPAAESNKTMLPPNDSSLLTWRNAAMDCVDTLHWAANATIALLSGAEHPTVMHLHLARVVILAPHKSIMTLALSVVSPEKVSIERSCLPTHQEAVDAEREVLQWAQRDESKARLVALHCGCFYWHIRRYSTMAFYEPISVFLATLSLWAYSYYSSKIDDQQVHESPTEDGNRSGSASRNQSPEHDNTPGDNNAFVTDMNPSPQVPDAFNEHAPEKKQRVSSYSADPDPTFIRLDRPNDDEMVQLFVRSGRRSNMRAFITGVGDIYGPEGPVRILREGRKILGTISIAWGRTKRYSDILEAMEAGYDQSRGRRQSLATSLSPNDERFMGPREH